MATVQDSHTGAAHNPLIGWVVRMKFGKQCEGACLELQELTNLPAFPYKSLKKQLKRVEESGTDDNPREAFFAQLATEVRTVDEAWKKAAQAALQAERNPRTSALLAKVGLARCRDDQINAALDECAQRIYATHPGPSPLPHAFDPAHVPLTSSPLAGSSIARTGLRKIKKKYNKRLAARFGVAEDVLDTDTYSFVRSRERTEIESLAKMHAAGSSQDAGTPETTHIECPVCLETLVNPVAPPCGHPMCRSCHTGMLEARAVRRIPVAGGYLLITPKNRPEPQCPLCRAPATEVQKMHSLARVAKAAAAVR